MNKVVTSKEELLDTARQIVFQEGIDQLSIRVLAKKLNISVGAVYNYFPSKSDLLLAIVESFWKGIFHKDICILSETLPFADFYEVVYHRLAEHMEDFFSITACMTSSLLYDHGLFWTVSSCSVRYLKQPADKLLCEGTAPSLVR